MNVIVEYKKGAGPTAVKFENVDRFSVKDDFLCLYRHGSATPRLPFISINADNILQFFVKETNTMFDTEMEKYLHENHGNLQGFMRMINAGTQTVGAAFVHCLSEPDKYRATKAGKGREIASENTFDSPAILEFIQWLDVDREKYPEDHPVWSMR